MLPFTESESRQMVEKFLDDIGYQFTEEEIWHVIGNNKDQRQIMSNTVQVLAEKISAEKSSRANS